MNAKIFMLVLFKRNTKRHTSKKLVFPTPGDYLRANNSTNFY